MEDLENRKEKWAEDVLQSINGLQRATPPQNLYHKISEQLSLKKSNIIPINRLRVIAAAIAGLVVLNLIAADIYLNFRSEVIVEHKNDLTVINDYSLYKE